LTYGIHLCKQKKPYEAEKYLEISIKTDPNKSITNLWYGYCLYLQHRDTEAEKYMHRAIYFDPTSVDANKFLGLYNLEKGNIESAERYLRIALFLSPTDDQIRKNLDMCASRSDRTYSRIGDISKEHKSLFDVVEIEYNKYWAMKIDLDYGDTLIAKMNVIGDDKIDVLFVDDSNFKKYVSGKYFESYRAASEAAVSTKVIVFTASIPSVYYLILDNTFHPVGGAIPKPGKVKVQVYAKRF
jgi:tetratricopeptide (TPR) repeat protein